MNRTTINGPFPTYPLVETIDLSIVLGWPSIPQVPEAILPMLELTGLYLAEEFSTQETRCRIAA